MSNKIKCPFCQTGYMDKVVPVHADPYTLIGCQAKCNACDAKGPMGYGDTHKECEDEAIRLANVRSQPANRVLTLDEIQDIGQEMPLWKEEPFEGVDFGYWVIFRFNRFLDPHTGEFAYLKSVEEEYSVLFRFWLRKPTEEERVAVPWKV